MLVKIFFSSLNLYPVIKSQQRVMQLLHLLVRKVLLLVYIRSNKTLVKSLKTLTSKFSFQLKKTIPTHFFASLAAGDMKKFSQIMSFSDNPTTRAEAEEAIKTIPKRFHYKPKGVP